VYIFSFILSESTYGLDLLQYFKILKIDVFAVNFLQYDTHNCGR